MVVVSLHSSGSSVSIHSQTDAASQALESSPIPAQNVLVDGMSPKQHPGAGAVGSIVGLSVICNVGSIVGFPVVSIVGLCVGGAHSGESSSPSIHEHSSAQHPSTSVVVIVSTGGNVVGGGGVNVQSSSSPPSIHEHTPADSH